MKNENLKQGLGAYKGPKSEFFLFSIIYNWILVLDFLSSFWVDKHEISFQISNNILCILWYANKKCICLSYTGNRLVRSWEVCECALALFMTFTVQVGIKNGPITKLEVNRLTFTFIFKKLNSFFLFLSYTIVWKVLKFPRNFQIFDFRFWINLLTAMFSFLKSLYCDVINIFLVP